MTTRRRYWASCGTARDNRDGPGGAGNTDRDLTRSSGTSREGLTVKVTSGPPKAPVNWDARHHLALSILTWRPPNSLTCALAQKALAGASIEELMSFERGVKADAEGGAA